MRVRHAQRTASSSHRSPGRPRSAMPKRGRDPLLVGGARRRVRGGLVRVLDGEGEHALLLASEHGEDAVRGQPGQRLVVLEPVGELRARLLLARHHPRHEPAARPQPLAQLADDVGVLGEPLDEDRPGALERRRRRRRRPVRVDVPAASALRVQRRVLEQAERQRLEPRLAGDLRLRPPLRLVRQVDVLEPGLGVGAEDLRLELRRELALLASPTRRTAARRCSSSRR